MKYEIIGDDFQILNYTLNPGEKIFAEAGEMIYASGNIKLKSVAKGGIGGILKRVVTGESLFLTEFYTEEGEGLVAFGKKLGKIIPIRIEKGKDITAKTDSYMVSTDGVDIEVTLVNKIGAGIFGGKGFILQKFSTKMSDQTVFLEATGQVITLDLEEGQMIKVDTGNIVAFESTVDYDIQRVGGISTMLLGGEGLFFSILRGSGRVWIQSVCLAELITSFSVRKTSYNVGNTSCS